MKVPNPIKQAFRREMQELRNYFGEVPDEAEPMEWEEAMERPLLVPIELDVGGEIEIKINHDKGPKCRDRR